jgi:hypothetical protein
MSLSVPPVINFATTSLPARGAIGLSGQAIEPEVKPACTVENLIQIRYDPGHLEMLFEEGIPCPVRKGDWVVITTSGRCLTSFVIVKC